MYTPALAPALSPAPATPRPACSKLRQDSCLAYVNSTLAGKSNKAYYDTVSKGKQYFQYSSGHKYIEIKSSKARKLARKLVSAL